MSVQSFSTLVTVRDHKLKLLDKGEFDRGLERFMDGQELVLTIEEPEAHHSRQQERFFHGPILNAFMRLGYRKEEAKAMLCLRCIPKDIKLLNGSIVTVPGSTSALGKKAYSELIDECIQLAAEEGLYISDVEEYRASQQKKKGKAA